MSSWVIFLEFIQVFIQRPGRDALDLAAMDLETSHCATEEKLHTHSQNYWLNTKSDPWMDSWNMATQFYKHIQYFHFSGEAELVGTSVLMYAAGAGEAL